MDPNLKPSLNDGDSIEDPFMYRKTYIFDHFQTKHYFCNSQT